MTTAQTVFLLFLTAILVWFVIGCYFVFGPVKVRIVKITYEDNSFYFKIEKKRLFYWYDPWSHNGTSLSGVLTQILNRYETLEEAKQAAIRLYGKKEEPKEPGKVVLEILTFK